MNSEVLIPNHEPLTKHPETQNLIPCKHEGFGKSSTMNDILMSLRVLRVLRLVRFYGNKVTKKSQASPHLTLVGLGFLFTQKSNQSSNWAFLFSIGPLVNSSTTSFQNRHPCQFHNFSTSPGKVGEFLRGVQRGPRIRVWKRKGRRNK